MEKLAGGPPAGRSDSPTSKGHGVGRQQQQNGLESIITDEKKEIFNIK